VAEAAVASQGIGAKEGLDLCRGRKGQDLSLGPDSARPRENIGLAVPDSQVADGGSAAVSRERDRETEAVVGLGVRGDELLAI
jgi:hypothetical protein